MASAKLPEYLCRGDACALLGVDDEQLDAIVIKNFGGFRKDGTMKTTTARKIADQLALARLRKCRETPHHPDQHHGHAVMSSVVGPWCRECGTPLFDWPESRALING